MTRVNMIEATRNLSELVGLLESHEEDVIYISRDGEEIAQITLVPKAAVQKRIGIAAGKITLPDDFDDRFDSLDSEITD